MDDDSALDHIRRAAKTIPRFAALLKEMENGPPPPEELAYLLGWYNELRARNTITMQIVPVPYSEIRAYRDLYQLEMDAFDVETLTMLDALWLKSVPKPDSKPGR